MNYDRDSFLAGLAVGRMLWRPPRRPPGIFDEQPICTHPAGVWPSGIDNTTKIGYQPHYNANVYISVSAPGVYCFGLTDLYHWYIVCRTNEAGNTIYKRLDPGGSSSLGTIDWSLDAATGLYVQEQLGGWWGFGFDPFYVPVFETLRAGLDALNEYLNS